jgi:DnaK suppressor protein
MNSRTLESLTSTLRERRRGLLDGGERSDPSESTPEVELEEEAQRERERLLSYRLDRRARNELEAIDAALRRIEEGSYGICRVCGADIASARLRALPTAELCLDCATEAERAKPLPQQQEEVESEGF